MSAPLLPASAPPPQNEQNNQSFVNTELKQLKAVVADLSNTKINLARAIELATPLINKLLKNPNEQILNQVKTLLSPNPQLLELLSTHCIGSTLTASKNQHPTDSSASDLISTAIVSSDNGLPSSVMGVISGKRSLEDASSSADSDAASPSSSDPSSSHVSVNSSASSGASSIASSRRSNASEVEKQRVNAQKEFESRLAKYPLAEHFKGFAGLSFDEQLREIAWNYLHSVTLHIAQTDGANYQSSLAQKSDNAVKNRYSNIHPYDYNVVTLGNDKRYINASRSMMGGREHIYTQGPKAETVHDFWEMLIENECTSINSLAMENEKNRPKCFNFWKPENFPLKIGDIEISYIGSEVIAQGKPPEGDALPQAIVKREFKINDGEDTRIITQFHYENWPDFGVPEEQLLLKLVELNRKQKGTKVTHCSAGVGRSGTLVALLNMADQIEADPNYQPNAPFEVIKCRLERFGMVQEKSQLQIAQQAALSYKKIVDAKRT